MSPKSQEQELPCRQKLNRKSLGEVTVYPGHGGEQEGVHFIEILVYYNMDLIFVVLGIFSINNNNNTILSKVIAKTV